MLPREGREESGGGTRKSRCRCGIEAA